MIPQMKPDDRVQAGKTGNRRRDPSCTPNRRSTVSKKTARSADTLILLPAAIRWSRIFRRPIIPQRGRGRLVRLLGHPPGPAGAAGRTAYSILTGNKARRTASGSPGLLPAACGRGLAESSSAGSGTLSRRNSSMRARITAKSSAARGRVMSPPFSFFRLTLSAVAVYRRREKLGTRNSRAVIYFLPAASRSWRRFGLVSCKKAHPEERQKSSSGRKRWLRRP